MQQLPPADEISRVAREILAEPEFTRITPGTESQVLAWVLEKLRLWLRWLVERAGDNEVLAGTVVVLALVAVGVVAWRLGRHVPALGGGRVEESSPENRLSSEEWFARAAELAERMSFRSAATALYQGVVLVFEQQGFVAFHASKTPGEYALEMGRTGRSAASGTRFLERFQRFSFGREAPTADGYAELAQMAESASLAAGRGGGPRRSGQGA